MAVTKSLVIKLILEYIGGKKTHGCKPQVFAGAERIVTQLKASPASISNLASQFGDVTSAIQSLVNNPMGALTSALEDQISGALGTIDGLSIASDLKTNITNALNDLSTSTGLLGTHTDILAGVISDVESIADGKMTLSELMQVSDPDEVLQLGGALFKDSEVQSITNALNSNISGGVSDLITELVATDPIDTDRVTRLSEQITQELTSHKTSIDTIISNDDSAQAEYQLRESINNSITGYIPSSENIGQIELFERIATDDLREIVTDISESADDSAIDVDDEETISSVRTTVVQRLSAHTHTMAEVVGLAAAIDAKANTVHTHSISDVTGLQDALDDAGGGDSPTFTGNAVFANAHFVNAVTMANTLTVEGTITSNAHLRAMGSVTPASGKSVEIYYHSDDTGNILAYDRSTSAYKPLRLQASEILLRPSGTERLKANTTGAAVTGEFTITGNVAIGDTTSSATANPRSISLGGTYSDTAAANPKLKLWDIVTSWHGFGVSSSQLDYMVGGADASHTFYVAGNLKATINNFGLSCGTIIRSTDVGTAPTSGVGAELFWNPTGSYAAMTGFDRATSEWQTVRVQGNTVGLYSGSTLKLNVDATGVAITGPVSATGNSTFANAHFANAVSIANTLTVTGSVEINKAASSTVPHLNLTGATSHWMSFGNTGAAAPTNSTRSAGTKIVLWDVLSATQGDYAIGIEGSHIWFSGPLATTGFKWYANTVQIMQSNTTGLTVAGRVSATGNSTFANAHFANAVTMANTLAVTGNVAISGELSVTSTTTTGLLISTNPRLRPSADNKSANFTLPLSAEGAVQRFNSTVSRTCTIPAEATTNFPIGATIRIYVINTSSWIIAPDVGVTLTWAGLTGNRTVAAGALVELYKVTTDSWLLAGSGIT